MKKLTFLLAKIMLMTAITYGQTLNWPDHTLSGANLRAGIWGVTHDYATDPNFQERTYSTGETETDNLPFFNGGPLGPILNGNRDVLITCHNNAGMLVWQVSFGGAGFDRGEKIHITRDNELYVVGTFRSAQMQVNTTGQGVVNIINQGGVDGFVARIDPANGNVMWIETIAGPDDEFVRDISSDHTDELFVIGDYSSNALNLSGTLMGGVVPPNNTAAGTSDIFVVGYLLQQNTGGTIFTANNYGGSQNDRGTGITSNVLGFGDVYFTASFEDNITINGTNLVSAGGSDAFVAHIASPWGFINTTIINHISSGANETSAKVYQEVTGNSDLLVCGTYEGLVLNIDDLNGNIQNLASSSGAGNPEAYILRITTNGTPVWANQLTGADTELARAVAYDGCGHVYFVGQYNSDNANTDDGANINGAPGVMKFFMTSHDYTNGNTNWAISSLGQTDDFGSDVEVCHSGGVNELDPVASGAFVDGMNIPGLVNLNGLFATTREGFLLMFDEAPLITVNQAGPFCETDPCVNLGFTIQPFGVWPAGTWAGPGITNPQTGQFCPQVAGNGLHTITYTIPWGGCNITGSTVIQVGNDPWPKQSTAPSINELSTGDGVAFDNNGGYYVTGSYQGQVTFHRANGTTVTLNAVNGSRDSYLARYNECGIDWAISLGSQFNGETGTGIAFDPISGDMFWVGSLVGDGSLVFSGQFSGTLNLATSGLAMNSTPTNVKKGFIARVTQAGVVTHIDIPDPTNTTISTYKDVKALTNSVGQTTLYTIGEFDNQFSFGGSLIAHVGGNDIFNGNYSPTLIEIGGFPYGSAGDEFAMALDIIYTQGTPTKTYLVDAGMASDQVITFGSQTIPIGASAGADPFFALVDITTGFTDHVFGRMDAPGSLPGFGFAMDVCPITTSTQGPQANFAITGGFNSTRDFEVAGGGGVPSLTPVGNQESFIATYDYNGALVWAIQGGGNGDENWGSSLVEVPSTGSIYAVGHYSQTGGNVPAGAGYLQGLPPTLAANDQDFYYAHLDINGNFTPTTSIQGWGYDDVVLDLGFDGTNLFTTGQFVSQIAFNNTLNSTGVVDMYFARMDLNRVHFLVAEEGEDSPSKPNEIGGTNGTSKTNEDSFDVELISKKIKGLSVYPNPSTTGIFNIISSSSIQKITVHDISGRAVYEASEINQVYHKVNLSSYAKGVYVLSIKTNNGIITKRVIR
jgi:hypothetical protein